MSAFATVTVRDAKGHYLDAPQERAVTHPAEHATAHAERLAALCGGDRYEWVRVEVDGETVAEWKRGKRVTS